jgi:hypothetical protein
MAEKFRRIAATAYRLTADVCDWIGNLLLRRKS